MMLKVKILNLNIILKFYFKIILKDIKSNESNKSTLKN